MIDEKTYTLDEAKTLIESDELDLGNEAGHVLCHCDKIKAKKSRPSFYDIEEFINGVKVYRNDRGHYYVPESCTDFNLFIDALFKTIENPTEKQVENYNLIKEYPFLLSKNRWDKGLMFGTEYGFDFVDTELDCMPKGWRKAFGMQLIKELKDELCKHKVLYEYFILDIKEKYGSLRWYDSGNTNGGYDIINKYSKLSQTICISCGERATHFTTGWTVPICDACDIKKNKKEI